MMQGESKKPKTWRYVEIYQEFAQKLLDENPQTTEMATRSYGNSRNRILVPEIYGGYWGAPNKGKHIKNYYIYTNRKGRIVEVINFKRWMTIVETYFTVASKHIIAGETLNLGNFIGRIEPSHIERSFKTKSVNFQETNKQEKVFDPALGRLKAAKVIYFTDPSYIRISWRKGTAKLENNKLYEFLPSDSFKDTFVAANKNNTELKNVYPYYPYISYIKKPKDDLQVS